MPSRRRSFLGCQFFLLGTFAWTAAVFFAVMSPRVPVKEVGPTAPEYAPNVAAAGAALGLGIGGGLCLLGAALLYSKGRGKKVVRPGPAKPAGAADTPGGAEFRVDYNAPPAPSEPGAAADSGITTSRGPKGLEPPRQAGGSPGKD
jgi:hypothetical protein